MAWSQRHFASNLSLVGLGMMFLPLGTAWRLKCQLRFLRLGVFQISFVPVPVQRDTICCISYNR